MKKILSIILLSIAGSYGIAVAQSGIIVSDKPGWHKIGSKGVDFKMDRDEITVIGADRFTAIKFKVTEAPIDLRDLEVYFEDGTKQDIPVNTPIMAGTESRVLDLNGSEKSLKKIVFVYKTINNRAGEKATVEVWGLKTNMDQAANPSQNDNAAPGNSPVPKPALIVSDKTGWHKIGDREVDFKLDRDELSVLGADRFASIKVKVLEASIEIKDLEVYFEDGTRQDIPVRSTMQVGSESRVFDLNGSEKRLKKIVFVYKTFNNKAGERAKVEVWGLKTNVDQSSVPPSKNDNAVADNNTAIPKPAVISSDKSGWHKIGETVVDFTKDRDEIVVLGADRFSSLRFRVTEAPIDIQDIEVYFHDGTRQDIQLRTPVMAGAESQLVDLKGGEKDLKKIVFMYKTLPNRGGDKAHVEIWGLKTNINRK